MTLKRIENTQTYYLSKYDEGLGETLMTGDINDLLHYVQNDLIINPSDIPDDEIYIDEDGAEVVISSHLTATDFQTDAIFTDLGENGVISRDVKWYILELNTDLYQIILTSDGGTTYLPYRKTWTGSLPDLIGFAYSKFSS